MMGRVEFIVRIATTSDRRFLMPTVPTAYRGLISANKFDRLTEIESSLSDVSERLPAYDLSAILVMDRNCAQ